MGEQWSLRTKLTLSAGALVGATLLLSGVALMAIRSGSRALERSSRQTARKMQLAGSLQTVFQQMRASGHASQIALVIELLEKDSKREGECSSCHDKGMVDRHAQSFHQASQVLDQSAREAREQAGRRQRRDDGHRSARIGRDIERIGTLDR